MTFEELQANVIQWAKDRNLIEGSTPEKQVVKIFEEFGELCAGVARNDIERIKDGIGDVLVVAVIISEMIDQPLTCHDLHYEIENIEHCIFNLAGTLRHEDDYCIYLLNELAYLASHYNLTLEECLSAAWEEIKDRKGRMENGIFLKEADLV